MQSTLITDLAGSKAAVDLVGFGVGCIGTSHVAQHQMGLLLLLREWLEGANLTVASVQVYDPIFCDSEKEALVELGCVVLETNNDGNFACDKSRMTLLYMPHCEAELYNNVIAANWAPHLSRVCIIGNSLRSYAARLPEERWSTMMGAVQRSLQWMQDCTLANSFKPADVFNDTSLQHWPRAPSDIASWDPPMGQVRLPMPIDIAALGPKPKYSAAT